MAMRPRRPGIDRPGVARMLSERDRAALQDTPPADPEAALKDAAQAAAQFGLGGLFDSLRTLAENLARQGGKQGGGERSFEVDGREGRMVFGYSVRTGLDGATAEPFGHVPPRGGAPAADTARQPIVDVFEEPEAIVVVAEIPGAVEGSVTCRVEGATLLIEASGARRYRKQVALPGPVLPASLTQTLRNGILEIRLQRGPAPP